MDAHLDLNLTMIRSLDELYQVGYLKEFGDVYKRPEKRLEPVLVDQEQWKRAKTYLWQDNRIVEPRDRILHSSSGPMGPVVIFERTVP